MDPLTKFGPAAKDEPAAEAGDVSLGQLELTRCRLHRCGRGQARAYHKREVSTKRIIPV